MKALRDLTCRAACLLLILGMPATFADDGPGAILNGLYDPGLGPAAAVQGVELSVGHLTIKLDNGSAAPILAGDKPLGLFFQGSGSYTYRSEEPMDQTAFAYMANKVSKFEPAKKGDALQVEDTFESLAIIGSIDLPELGTGGGDLGESFGEHRKYFDGVWWLPEHALVQQLADMPQSQVAYAEIRGATEEVTYLYDGSRDKVERFCNHEKARYQGGRGLLFEQTLSEQPVGRNRLDFVDPAFLLTHVDLDFTASKKEDAQMTVVETIIPRGMARSVFRFDFTRALADAEGDTRQYNIRSITDGQGNELAFDHRRGELLVLAASPVPANAELKLTFEVDGNFLIRPGGDSFWLLRGDGLLPSPQVLAGEYWTLDTRASVEKPWVPIAMGDTIERTEGETHNTVVSKMSRPSQLPILLGGRYYIHEESFDDMTIRVASYGQRNKRAFQSLSQLAHKVIGFYEQFLGDFPYDEFNIIEIHDTGAWGQAPPATMFITSEAFNPLTNQEAARGVNERFAHEIAHQYWGHVVKMGSWDEQWITESFAEYTAAMAIRQLKGDQGYSKMVGEWKRQAGLVKDAGAIPVAMRLADASVDGNLARFNLLYNKGPYVLYALHQEIGDDKFAAFMRNYQKGMEWQFGNTPSMVGLLKALTGKDYQPFFDKYVYGTALPDAPDPSGGKKKKKKKKKRG
ncbi:hypothetical protein ABI59_03525 [Acidobacteria bacterium Mor1]|nr:hypothetical protein ABI59_03525 [Acidobacteria bacterium Mor1]